MEKKLVQQLRKDKKMEIIEECSSKMSKTIEALHTSLATIRSGKVSPSVLDRILVEYYGEMTPIKAMAGIQTPSSTQLLIRPFDPTTVKAIQQAIGASDLGVNPVVDGGAIRLTFPSLTTERRNEFAKQAKKICEDAKVAIRNIRRDYNEIVKKDKTLSEDVAKSLEKDIQKETDKHIKKIDEIFAAKEKELFTI